MKMLTSCRSQYARQFQANYTKKWVAHEPAYSSHYSPPYGAAKHPGNSERTATNYMQAPANKFMPVTPIVAMSLVYRKAISDEA